MNTLCQDALRMARGRADLRAWLTSGPQGQQQAREAEASRPMLPKHRRLQRESTQQLAVVARYSDGSVEDITHTVQYESNNKDLADVDEHGLVSLKNQSGVVSVMARYQGQVAVFQASIPPLAVSWPWQARIRDFRCQPSARSKQVSVHPPLKRR